MNFFNAVGIPLDPSFVKMWVCFRGKRNPEAVSKVLWTPAFRATENAAIQGFKESAIMLRFHLLEGLVTDENAYELSK